MIIIGGSYAGLAAAMALGRALRRVLVIDAGIPCNRQTPQSHNFLTRDGMPPAEIAAIARAQVEQYPSVTFAEGTVTASTKAPDVFEVMVQSGERYMARKLVFATGIKDMMPEIPGFAASWGISVLHCPYCHGYEVRHQPTGILTNGNDAYELAMLINNWTSKLTVYTNGTSALSEQQAHKLEQHGVRIVEEEIVMLEQDKGQISKISFRNGEHESISALYARLPFVQHCPVPQELGCAVTQEGYIVIDGAHQTTVPGIFACGDNVTRMRTVANAVSMGTTTGMMVNRVLIEEEF